MYLRFSIFELQITGEVLRCRRLRLLLCPCPWLLPAPWKLLNAQELAVRMKGVTTNGGAVQRDVIAKQRSRNATSIVTMVLPESLYFRLGRRAVYDLKAASCTKKTSCQMSAGVLRACHAIATQQFCCLLCRSHGESRCQNEGAKIGGWCFLSGGAPSTLAAASSQLREGEEVNRSARHVLLQRLEYSFFVSRWLESHFKSSTAATFLDRSRPQKSCFWVHAARSEK